VMLYDVIVGDSGIVVTTLLLLTYVTFVVIDCYWYSDD